MISLRPVVVKLISKHYYIFEEAIMSARERRNSCCWWGGSCKPRAMTANSAPPNGWRSASSPALTRSHGPHRHLRNFKRRPVARHHKPLRRLWQVGTWSDNDPGQMGEASLSA